MQRKQEKKASVWMVMTAAVVLLIFSGCDMLLEILAETDPAESRVNSFLDGINSDGRDKVYTHIHPGAEDYDEAKTAAYWETDFPPAETFSLGELSAADTSETVKTVTTTISSVTTYDGDAVTITVEKYTGSSTETHTKDKWYIKRIEIEVLSAPVIKRLLG